MVVGDGTALRGQRHAVRPDVGRLLGIGRSVHALQLEQPPDEQQQHEGEAQQGHPQPMGRTTESQRPASGTDGRDGRAGLGAGRGAGLAVGRGLGLVAVLVPRGPPCGGVMAGAAAAARRP